MYKCHNVKAAFHVKVREKASREEQRLHGLDGFNGTTATFRLFGQIGTLQLDMSKTLNLKFAKAQHFG